MSDLNAVIDDALRRIIGIIIPAVETAIRADERAKTAEDIARAVEALVTDLTWNDDYTTAVRDAAAIARQHANGTPSADAAGRTGADAYPTEGAP